jgi:hypothetical protein
MPDAAFQRRGSVAHVRAAALGVLLRMSAPLLPPEARGRHAADRKHTRTRAGGRGAAADALLRPEVCAQLARGLTQAGLGSGQRARSGAGAGHAAVARGGSECGAARGARAYAGGGGGAGLGRG